MAARSETGAQSTPERKQLGGAQIRADFGPKGRIAKLAITNLCNAIAASGRSTEFLARWKAALALPETARKLLAGDDASPFSRPLLSMETEPETLLFTVQTYFALVVKIITARAVFGRNTAYVPSRQEPLSLSIEALAAIESGEAFREVGVCAFPQDDCYGWYLEECSESLVDALRHITECANGYGLTAHSHTEDEYHELFGELYASLIPRKLRHSLGEYYTPEWLVDFVLDCVGYDGDPSMRLIDPSCGSGAFLVRAIGRAMSRAARTGSRRDSKGSTSKQFRLPRIAGVDINPLAVLAAKASYIIALRHMFPFEGQVNIPVHTFDLITGAIDEPKGQGSSRVATELKPGRFDLVVGNPPWVLWDNLSPEYREATKPLWRDYGLFSLSGSMSV